MFKTSFSPLDGQVVHNEHERNFLREAEMERLAYIAQPPKARPSFTLLTKIWHGIRAAKQQQPAAPTLEAQSRPSA